MDFSRGSEWRRWDIHIHTPGTMKSDRFRGQTLDEKWDAFYSDVSTYIGNGADPKQSISVIGITDYFSIANYKKVVSEGRLPSTVDLILPNVELRMTPVTGSGSPINIHCIFNPTIVDELEARFFTELKFNGGGEQYNASKDSLIRYGKIVASDESLEANIAIRKAINNMVISFEQLKRVFVNDLTLRENTIIAVSNSSKDGVSGCRQHKDYKSNMDKLENPNSQLAPLLKSIYKFADIIFSANPSNRDFFLGLNENFDADCIRTNYGSLKPCFHGSDAHTNDEIFNPDQERYCWVKADPTFEGLKQTLNEPKERVFIGKVPEILPRVNAKSTKYLKCVKIDTISDNHLEDIWFKDVEIPLNTGLVAIIGNKGSGKSALADIIGLCTDAKHSSDFQFLNKDRFLKKGYAERFSAQVEFLSNNVTEERVLNQSIDPTAIPKVQYLPQSYFETVCNELGKASGFRKEIEQVVFQHIPEDQKLGKGEFQELLAFKRQPIDQEIYGVKNKIVTLNKEIILLEDKRNPEYRVALENRIKLKEEEIHAHQQQKPTEVPKPEKHDDELLSPESKDLKKWEDKREKYDKEVALVAEQLKEIAIHIVELTALKRDFEQKIHYLQEFIESNEKNLRKYGLKISELFQITYNPESLETLIVNKKQEKERLLQELGTPEITDDTDFNKLQLRAKVSFCQHEIQKISKQLSSAEQSYQVYSAAIVEWEKALDQLVGKADVPDSLEYYKAELDYVDNNLDAEIYTKRADRIILSLQILDKKLEIKTFYDQIKETIDEQLSSFEEQSLNIDTTLTLDADFADEFMGYVDKGRQGSFRGVLEGEIRLRTLTSPVEWNRTESVRQFLEQVVYNFDFDCREDIKKDFVFIGNQIPKRQQFYDFLFSLDYLQPIYELKQGGKALEELSPGEKGALLLIFYLILDKNDIPLLIDQPEDNLDNKSVATVLVPYIKEAKKRRQIIMVTHNPNLAVVADAEQIIRVDIDKENRNTFSFIAGSIENSNVNKAIVEVLEGTMPAFTTRKNKYSE